MVSPDTREAVQKAAAEVGYQPNLIARSLRTQSTNSIFVLLPSLESPFYPEIIRGLDWAAHERGYAMMLGLTGNEKGRQSSYIDLARRQRPDGVIVLDCELTHLLGANGPFQAPAVQVLEKSDGSPHPSVTIDDRAAAAVATRHLVELGHRRIAHILGMEASTVAALRHQGYLDALAEAGIAADPALMVRGNFQHEGGINCASQLMAEATPPTAIFCANDETAIGAILRLKQLGYSVPQDVSIIGFDDIERSAVQSPPLTTIRQPRFEIGTAAMTLLLDTIAGKILRQPHVTLPVELILRSSTAPPRAQFS
jgi:LacI family repressor for deo operon, udp, cdd, tsx, nupC, and nupG